jgi:hypothetical protein
MSKEQGSVQEELLAIKRLLMLFLIKVGASQSELSIALQIDQANVSRMLPARKIVKLKP